MTLDIPGYNILVWNTLSAGPKENHLPFWKVSSSYIERQLESLQGAEVLGEQRWLKSEFTDIKHLLLLNLDTCTVTTKKSS